MKELLKCDTRHKALALSIYLFFKYAGTKFFFSYRDVLKLLKVCLVIFMYSIKMFDAVSVMKNKIICFENERLTSQARVRGEAQNYQN